VTSVASGEDTTSGGGGEDTTTGGDADVNVMFNFQNNSGDIPAGYLKDHGRGYDEATGYGWITEASVGSDAPVALDILTSGRDRNIAGYDQRLDTFIHMEDTNFSAAWEYKIANGTYAVTVSVGDGLVDDSDSSHSINIEGVSVIDNFMATPQRAYDVETAVVTVTDGKLTIDSVGGTKTKLNFVEIESVNTDTQPTIASASPLDNAVDVNRSKAVAFDVSLKEVGVGVDGASLTNATVSLYKTNGFEQIQGNLNTSGGGDTIIFKPTTALEANTDYTLIMDGATDANGTEFIPYTTSFTTGEAVDVQAAQHTISVVAEHDMAISLQISPDESQLYATTVDGKIMRWDIDPTTGALSNKETFLDLQGDPSTPSAIIGLAFDPNDPNVLWVSHNGTYFAGVEDFTGQVSKLHLQDGEGFNATVEEYIIGLPRSNHDHMTNSLSFGPDGDLYVTQGSNTAMGALDTAWGEREERELTAAVLKIDPDVETNGVPINVQTEDYMLEDGTMTFGDYDPYAANAPVQIFATGMRNAYDHVWHSNGELYVPDNGSAAGGVVPDDPNTAANERVASVGSQHDVLYQVEEGGYYGHPNASRGEYILRGGNPTDGVDPGEVVPKNGFKGYNVGVQPDPDYQTHVFDFGDKQSANGIIELKTDGYGASFQNNLLVVRYSAGNDIVSIQLDAQGNVVGSSIFASDLVNPLDLVEHGSSGRIYLAEFRGYESKISMFTPSEDGSEGTGSGGGEDTTSGGSGGDTVPGGTDTEFLGLYEAEDADYTGPELRNHREGFTGEGFLDFSNTVDDYIEWTVQNADAGMYQLDWRYALGDNARPLDLYINEQLVVNNLNFDNTGGWGNWQEVGVQAQLQAGTNTIRLEADGSSGGNIDSMTISEIDAVA
ncbi:MAG: carbohydrate-binding protein, partial [Alphaproteobacteria bacterium]|nr:carbohydrate-binding protein [Alphaproteobacteria bacterium]